MKNNDQFKRLLRERGIRATAAMIDVVRVLEKEGRPLSIEEIMRSISSNVHTSTIYRILERFLEKQIVRTVDLRHGHVHYEINRNDDHHHLICTACGKIEDISGCAIEALSKKIIRTSTVFSYISNHSLEFFGTCCVCFGKQELNT